MSKEVIVESFELDHTIVKAPYVRLIGKKQDPKETSSPIMIFAWCNQTKTLSLLPAFTLSSTS